MQILDADAVHRALRFDRLVPALRERFALGCAMPPRQSLELGPVAPGGSPLRSLVMAAWVPGACYGVKVINIQTDNAAAGLPGLHAVYLLFDAGSGVPIALIDGDALTARRTAATSALAASYLAPENAERLLVIGAGRIASLLPDAHRSVRPSLREVVVWARRSGEAKALVARLPRELGDGLRVRAADVEDLEAESRAADIVSCATLARAPVVQGAWLAPGSHLDLIGSFAPDMREADSDAILGADLYLDVEEALQKSGDLLAPVREGRPAPLSCGTLAELTRGDVARRAGPEVRTVFKSVGSALADLAAAMQVVHRPA